jgi:hypothetical protein
MLFFYFFFKDKIKPSYHFYYWKSVYSLASNSKATPTYIKVLELSFPSSLRIRKTRFKTKLSSTFVPVIYMDNSLWLEMSAKMMVNKVLDSLHSMSLKDYEEIQIDCDWSGRTKKRYFNFLKLLKEESRKRISVTIRLHQVKYYKTTGVPLVDYGVLMYYNMSDFKDIETKNYILDLELARQYHYNFSRYPLHLNLALALYSQATIIRFQEVVGIMEGVREEGLNHNFKKLKEHLYEVTKTHYFKERLLYMGDKIRVDEVTVEMLKEAVNGLKKVMPQPKEIIFYRWGNREQYRDESLKDIVESWL